MAAGVATALGTGFLSGVLANYATRSSSVEKVTTIFQSSSYSKYMDRFSENFAKSLKNSIELDDEEIDWSEFAEHLDETEAVFETEEKGIEAIVEAIEATHKIDFDDNPQLRKSIKADVTEAYQKSIDEFTKEVAKTDLADVLEAETHINLMSTSNEICENLTKIQKRIRRQQNAALQNIGFDRIDEYFEWDEPEDLVTAWRTGFGLSEVKAGYPLRRERTTPDRRCFSTELIEKLQKGENIVILGTAGSGKSTVCKTVACEWYEDPSTGPVFYRKNPTEVSFTDPGTLNESIQAEEDEVLVVVEDATDEDSITIFDVIDKFHQNEDVCFLLEARRSDWLNDQNPSEVAKIQHQRGRLTIEDVPRLDETECQRAVDHYEDQAGEEIDQTGKELYKEIEQIEQADIGGALLLAYRLTEPRLDVAESTRSSPLHAHVSQVYSDVHNVSDEKSLREEVATMINVLNTADLPIEDAYIYSLASDRKDRKKVREALRFLDGRIFKRDEYTGVIRTPHQLWSTLYLEILLDDSGFDNFPARDQFEKCVDGLFRLLDNERKQETVQRLLPRGEDIIQQIQEKPEEQSKRVVQKIASIGQTRPSLGQLLGSPEKWRVDLPDNCPTTGILYWYNSRGTIHLNRNDLEAARLEFKECEKVLESLSKGEAVYSDWWYKKWQSMVKSKLGRVYKREGDLEKAENYFEESLVIHYNLGNKQNVAGNLVSLGTIARMRGDFEIAEKYLKDSIKTNRYLVNVYSDLSSPTEAILSSGIKSNQKAGNIWRKEENTDSSSSKAISFGQKVSESNTKSRTPTVTFGSVLSRGNITNSDNTQYIILEERLEENQDCSIVCFGRDINEGDTDSPRTKEVNRALTTLRTGPQTPSVRFGGTADDANVINLNRYAMSLNSLGHVAMDCSELEDAKEYFQKSLRIKREVGNRHGQALTLNSLGRVARQQGELGHARDYIEKSLRIKKETGDRLGQAISYDFLGHIAREQGDLVAAERFYEESLHLSKVSDNRSGQAISLDGLGQVYRQRGNLVEAEAKHRESMNINERLDNRHGRAVSLDCLGRIAKERGDYMEAKEHHQESLEIDQEEGHQLGQAHSQLYLGEVSVARGNVEDAADRFKRSLALYKELNNYGGKIRSIVGLITVASELEDWDRLEDYTDGLLELYKGVIDIEDMFTALEKSIDRTSSEGDYSRAIRLCDRGIELAGQANDEKTQETFQFKKNKFLSRFEYLKQDG